MAQCLGKPSWPEVSRRIGAALGPGWPRAVKPTLQMTFAGALMTARFVTFPEIAGQLDEAASVLPLLVAAVANAASEQ